MISGHILFCSQPTQMHLISQGYVMSNHLVASYLAMVSEERSVNHIYGELLSCRGSEIQIRRFDECLRTRPGEELSFWEISRIMSCTNEILIGYIPQQTGKSSELRRGLSIEARKDDILLNPPRKNERRVWSSEDRLIVIGLCHRARIKADLRLERRQAEQDLVATTLSGAQVSIYGWIKKLGTKHHHAIEMDDEQSWRDRLAYVVDGAMYYVSEKRRGSELVCRLDDVREVEVGNGWPPGYFTFKVYLARDPDAGPTAPVLKDLPLESLPSRVFSASTIELCSEWVKVLSRDGQILQDQPASNEKDPSISRGSSPLGRSGSPSRCSPRRNHKDYKDALGTKKRSGESRGMEDKSGKVDNGVHVEDIKQRAEVERKAEKGRQAIFSDQLSPDVYGERSRRSLDVIPGSGRQQVERKSLDVSTRPAQQQLRIDIDRALECEDEQSDDEDPEDEQHTGWESMFPSVMSEWRGDSSK